MHQAAVAPVEVPGSKTTVVLPDHDEYRVVCGSGSERVSGAFVLKFTLLFYPVSRVGFGGLIYSTAEKTNSTAR